jgi:putative ABC transport system permease protein
MDTSWQDLRLALRRLRSTPAFTAVAVLTLALAIGANTAAFSVVEGTLLGWSASYWRPDELVMAWQRKADERWLTTPADFRDWRARAGAFAGLAAYHYGSVSLSGPGEHPHRASVAFVTADMFEVLGTGARLGRAFAPGEDVWERRQVALLSHGLWRREFGGDPAVLGRRVRIDGEPREIVGVMAPGAWFSATPVDLWLPLAFPPGDPTNDRNSHYLSVVGRLRAGITAAQGRASLDAVAAQLEREHPQNQGLGATLWPLQEAALSEVRPSLLLMMGAVGLVLLTACANLANLMLARSSARVRELALRATLGASRGRLLRQLLTESLLLALAGGALGLLFAWWANELALAVLPALPRVREAGLALDGGVLAFTAALSVFTTVLFGVGPALLSSSTSGAQALTEGGRGGTANRRTARARSALVVSEMALATVLLAGAGLLLRSFLLLEDVDPGVRRGELLTLRLAPPPLRARDDADLRAFFERVVARTEALPGVEVAGVSSHRPLGGGGMSRQFGVDGDPPPRSLADVPTVSARQESARSLQALGVTLVSGRLFAEADRENAERVCVINQTLARRFFAGREALGRRILLEAPEAVLTPDRLPPGGRWARWTVVGVVRDVRYQGLAADPEAVAYVPYRQRTAVMPWAPGYLIVRASHDAAGLVPAIRRLVAEVDPDQAVGEAMTLDDLVAAAVGPTRVNAGVIAAFGVSALLLALLGIYGVLSYTVGQRRREIGVRMALGARAADVVRLVASQAGWLTALGTAAGLSGAIAAAAALRGLLYGVKPADPPTLLAVAGVLAAAAALASYVPARRAAGVDPASALRDE